MFDIGWSEFLVIGIVALIAIGPKELPSVLRAVGQWVGKIRSMAADFQGQFQEAMREAEMSDLKKQVDDVTGNFTAPFDPIAETETKSYPAASEPTPSAGFDAVTPPSGTPEPPLEPIPVAADASMTAEPPADLGAAEQPPAATVSGEGAGKP
jgi:sec-independent protein translocase protein TatB